MERFITGSDWTPKFRQDNVPEPDRVAPYTMWNPQGDWIIELEYFCNSRNSPVVGPNTLLIFKKRGGPTSIRTAVVSYDGQGDLLFHPLVDDAATDMKTELSTDTAALKVPCGMKTGNVYWITLRHENGLFSMEVDGVSSDYVPTADYDHVRHDMVMLGRYVNNAFELKGAANGQFIEMEMIDEANPRNSRLYHFVQHNPQNEPFSWAPEYFINHFNPLDGATHVVFQDEGGNKLVGNQWMIKVPDSLMFISGPNEIVLPGVYEYYINHGFTSPQEITWNTNGTQLHNFDVHSEARDGKYYYKCSFIVEPEKWFDTRIHLNAIIANKGMLSKVIGDLREPQEADVDYRPIFASNKDDVTGAIPGGSVANLATAELRFDAFVKSNFTHEDADVGFKVTSTDMPGAVITVAQADDAPAKVTYSQILSPSRAYGNFATVSVEMEVVYKNREICPVKMTRQFVFDKTELLTVLLGTEWADEALFNDDDHWIE